MSYEQALKAAELRFDNALVLLIGEMDELLRQRRAELNDDWDDALDYAAGLMEHGAVKLRWATETLRHGV